VSRRSIGGGLLSEEEFERKLEETNFAFLAAYRKANTDWICPECGEPVPNTLSQCWKCEAMKPGAESEGSDDEEVHTPTLDKAMGGEGTLL